MQRCRKDSLNALRVVLGNQAYAERIGGQLQMSREVSFATQQTMRTLIDRFASEGLAKKERRMTAPGCVNEVAVFRGVPSNHGVYENEYIRLQRTQEEEDFYRMVVFPAEGNFEIEPEAVPY